MIFGFGPCLNEVLDFIHCHAAADMVRRFKTSFALSRTSQAEQQRTIDQILDAQSKADEVLQSRARLQGKRRELEGVCEYRKLSSEELDELNSLEAEMTMRLETFWSHREKARQLADISRKPRQRLLENFVIREGIREHHAKRDGKPVNMSKWRISACRKTGGCCSRGCGCCGKPRMESPGDGTYGHCTVECSCCVAYYGTV